MKRKTGGRDFLPGNTFGKGRPRIPESLRDINVISADSLKRIFSQLLSLSRPELEKLNSNEGTPALELAVSSILLKAIEVGDHSRINWLLDRLVGKPKDSDIESSIKEQLCELTDDELVALTEEHLASIKARTSVGVGENV